LILFITFAKKDMGGTALNSKGVITERKDTKTFLKIGKHLQKEIYTDLGVETAFVKCYHTKQDHGDLDLLAKVPNNKFIDYLYYIESTFHPKAIYTNANVHSFDYENFQIDFIKIPYNSWEIANTYYSYDPCGNIMGKAYHKFGLSYGWDGLCYKFRGFSGANCYDIPVSKDPRKIFEFGGYNYDRFLQGFETLEDIYKFCIDSKYFDIDTFRMENLSQIDRKRNRKRKSYAIFLEYVENLNIDKSYQFLDKLSYIPMIDAYFPEANLQEKLNKLFYEDDLNRQAHEKFNGEIIMQWIPGLEGKELGAAISKFKNYKGIDYRTFILNNTIDEIKDMFMDVYFENYLL
jgi:hypothetical protein